MTAQQRLITAVLCVRACVWVMCAAGGALTLYPPPLPLPLLLCCPP